IVVPTTQKTPKKPKSAKLLKPRTPTSKESTSSYYSCMKNIIRLPENDRVRITELTHKCKCSKEEIQRQKAEVKHKLVHELARDYKNLGENLGKYVKADIVASLYNGQLALRIALGAFALIALFLILFFGYSLKLSARTAKLEKKNGKEQKQIEELKNETKLLEAQIEQLKRGVKN
ncbi:26289_t:CDS:2, partial [Gigaspora margarita]